MNETASRRRSTAQDETLPPTGPIATTGTDRALTPAGQAALAAAHALARKATAPATLRAYKADWTHFAAWCDAHGFVPVPAASATVGAYLASLAGSHAPSTIRRRLSALVKMYCFNDPAWNPAHRDIQGPLQGVLRTHGRPAQPAAALSLAMLRQLLATCDTSKRDRRNRVATGARVIVAIADLIIWRTARDGDVDGRRFGRGGDGPSRRLGSVADRLEAASCRPN